MNEKIPQVGESWWKELQTEFAKPYLQTLRAFLKQELKSHTVYPPMPQLFSAFRNTPFNKVKIVLLGQDPYHGPGQAHGLCFSVPQGVFPPPSLMNIFQEISNDLKIKMNRTRGDLTAWARQGVFLLNCCLTVRARQAGSHRNQGWEIFTDQVIQTLSKKRERLVFLLWGSYAAEKKKLIDPVRHLTLQAPHPSPLSASRGFFGCRHFSKANAYLSRHGMETIDWKL